MDSLRRTMQSRRRVPRRCFFAGGLALLIIAVAAWCQAQDEVDDDLEETLEQLNAAIRRNPKRADGYRNRGIFCRDLGDNVLAVNDFSEAIRLEPNNAANYILRGTIWNSRGKYDKALNDFDAALRIDPRHSRTYTYRASVWHSKGDLDKALDDSNAAIRLAPKAAEGFV